jgi:hypothetical protein
MSITRFPHGISSFGMPLLGSGGHMTTGNVFFVHNTNGGDGNVGTDPTVPFKTLDYAIGKCTASQGDTIILMEGHAETITAAIALDVAGLTIIGLGSGDARPTITVNAAVNGLFVTTANQRIYNVKFVTGASYGITTKLFALTGGVGNHIISDCHFQVAAATKMYHLGYVLGAVGSPITFRNCLFENLSTLTIAGNGTKQKNAILIRNGDVNIIGCRFIDMGTKAKNKWVACVKAGSVGVGHLASNISIQDCVFTSRGVAVTNRAAAVSPRMSIIRSQGISTSANTAVANIFLVTYANIVDSYAIGAVNVRAKMVPAATEA